MRAGIVVLLAAAVLDGCASGPPLPEYYWGGYPGAICVSQMAPERFSADSAVQALERDRQQALAMHRRLPPGWHAHLGTLYYQLGKLDLAKQEFEGEKREFPESAVFMDRLLAGMAR